MQAVTSVQMREIDRRAREEFGIPEVVLMEHAGAAVAAVAGRLFHRSARKGSMALVLSGGGANGGDGFVAARHLDNSAIPVEVLLVADPERVAGSARVHMEIVRRLAVPIQAVRTLADWDRWSRFQRARRSRRIGLAVDALLGTGFSGEVREPTRSVIRWLNSQRFPVVSVDVPSGLSADTGLPSPVAVKATVTVACGLPKVGFTKGQGRRSCGRVVVADISLPKELRS